MYNAASNQPPIAHRLVVCLPMSLSVVLLLHEEVLVCAVCGKSNGRNAQSRECGLEAVESGKRSGVPPLLTINQPVNIWLGAQNPELLTF